MKITLLPILVSVLKLIMAFINFNMMNVSVLQQNQHVFVTMNVLLPIPLKLYEFLL